MAITLTITDLANDSDATVVIAGADAAPVNIKSYNPSTGLWTTVGVSPFGNASITATFGQAGLYWVHASGTVSGAPAYSIIYPATITRTDKAVWETILQCMLADLQTLLATSYFPGLTEAGDIQRYTDAKQMLLAMSGDGLPAIGIAPGDLEQIQVITSAQDDIGYPVMVVYKEVADPKQDDEDNADLKIIRERIRRRYIAQRCPGYARAQTANVTPMSAHQFEQMGYNGISSGQLFTFIVRESRGVY